MKILAIILFLTMYVLMTVFMNRRIWIVLATALIFIVSGILPPASILSAINWKLRERNKRMVLITPGRICTSSPELGVPSAFADISEFDGR